MTSPAYCVLDGDAGANPARHPTIEDLGGSIFEQPIDYPPHDTRRLPLRGYVQAGLILERMCRVVPWLRADIQVAPSPGVCTKLYVSSLSEGITTSTLVVTRPAFHLHTLTWPATAMPTANVRATITPVGTSYSHGATTSSLTANAITVVLFDSAGGYADTTAYRFKIEIWCNV